MGEHYVPAFIKVSVTEDDGGAGYVVSNEATGKYFLANRATVTFLDAMNRVGDLGHALHISGIAGDAAKPMLSELMRHGVLVRRGATHAADAPKAPIESKVISLRFDLVDAASIARRLTWLGRAAFSRVGFAVWCLAVMAMIYGVVTNPEKALYALGQVPGAGLADVVRFIVLIIGLKVVHELGHALAYRIMCLRSGLDPGPIRMGIAIFALTPFPFTDVTGAWRLRGRMKRAVIGSAGIYFELGLTALLTIYWAQTTSGPFQVTIFQVAIFTAATTILFNLNPAVKLDGYYVLSDLLGQHNIAGRASQSARAWLTRRLGGKASRPERPYLAYWLLSYGYRWILFSGVFWIFYQVDARLAWPVGAIILLTLLGRPVTMSLRYAVRQGATPMRLTLTASLILAFCVVAIIPFPDRLLLDGRTSLHETRFVHVPEAARLTVVAQDGETRLLLDNPGLAFQAADLALREDMLANTQRAFTGNAAEQARLASDAASLQRMTVTLSDRLEAFEISARDEESWDLKDARRFDGAWLRPGATGPLAVLTQPSALRVELWLNQGLAEKEILSREKLEFRVRLTAEPTCAFNAETTVAFDEATAQKDAFHLTAFPLGEMPDCVAHHAQGADVVARLETAPKSIVDRAVRTARRLLQNRLPGQNLPGSEAQNN